MKSSRSTSRPRRLARRSSSGTWIGIAALVAVCGAVGYLGHEMGWWSGSGKAPHPNERRAEAGLRPVSNGRATEIPREPTTPTAAPVPGVTQESKVPSDAITVPRFGKDFDDAIERGAFRDAEAALAKIGGAADAERRLAAAMDAACRRIVSRFEEIRRASGEREARVYVTHQLVNFPDRADARGRIQALLAAPESAPAELGVRPPPPRSQPESRPVEAPVAAADADLAATKDEAARVLESGEIKTALSVLREVATAAESRNQRAVLVEAQRLIRMGEAELRLRRIIVDRVQRKVTGDRVVSHLPGERGAILEANDEGITFAGAQGQVKLKWRVLPVHAMLAIIPLLELTAPEAPDAAATLYRAGRATEADALLAKASQAGDPSIRRAIDQTIADARAIPVPAEGFRLVEDRWLSPQEFARHEIAREIAQSTKELAAADPAARKAAFARLLKLGDAAKSPLNRALLLRRAEVRDEIAKAPVYPKLAELGARRQEVDEARARALELIEDETKYPYPYRPPEASAETFKQYETTQREIDIRVAKLRGLWGQQIAVAVPKAFRDKVALLTEIDGFLSALGATAAQQDPGWLMHLPASEEVALQTTATSEADRARIDESAATMHTNATRAAKATRGELDQARITNEYRIMFGRAAVLVHDQLTEAAHGHCEDMARLGFFAHQSPVPGKANPDDRVRLTGMKPLGVSENIAQSSGPAGAHNGWCHSSGHHRNLLAAGWRLLGVGNSGHLWCQNFSAGEQKPLEPSDGGDGQ